MVVKPVHSQARTVQRSGMQIYEMEHWRYSSGRDQGGSLSLSVDQEEREDLQRLLMARLLG